MNCFNQPLYYSIKLNTQEPKRRSKWYAALPMEHEPVPFIETENDTLSLNPKAVEILNSIETPLDIVVVAGEYRSGKSYLLNRLAGKPSGFALGATVQSQTKGIWIWPVSHPSDRSKCLLLADTEGLGDAEKGDSNHDNKIFILAILMSNTLVYNSIGKINQKALEKLHLMANLSDHISIGKDKANANQLDGYLPSFIWTLRDFFLELEIDGRTVTADEYMEHCLKTKNSGSEDAEKYNEIRLRIRNYFKERKCFDFPYPTLQRRDIQRLDQLKDDQLDEEFVSKSNDFCEYIFQNSKVKRLDNGKPITGKMLVVMMKSYVDAINKGAVACIKDAVEMMSMIENQKALDTSLKDYKRNVKENLKMPRTMAEILSVLTSANEQAARAFASKAVLDTKHEYRDKLVNSIIEENVRVVKEIEGISKDTCENLLKEGFRPIEEKLEKGSYSTQQGFWNYIQDMDGVADTYDTTPEKGNMASTVLIDFLKEKTGVRNAIMTLQQQIIEIELKKQAKRHGAEMKKMENVLRKEKTLVEDVQAERKQLIKRVVQMMNEMDEVMAEEFQYFNSEIADLTAEVQALQDELDKRRNDSSSASSNDRRSPADSFLARYGFLDSAHATRMGLLLSVKHCNFI